MFLKFCGNSYSGSVGTKILGEKTPHHIFRIKYFSFAFIRWKNLNPLKTRWDLKLILVFLYRVFRQELLIKILVLFHLYVKKGWFFFPPPEMFQSPWNFQWETLQQWRMKWPKRENESCPLWFRNWGQHNPMGCGRINFKSLTGTAWTCASKNSFQRPQSSEFLAAVVQIFPKFSSTCCSGTDVFWGRFKQVLS